MNIMNVGNSFHNAMKLESYITNNNNEYHAIISVTHELNSTTMNEHTPTQES